MDRMYLNIWRCFSLKNIRKTFERVALLAFFMPVALAETPGISSSDESWDAMALSTVAETSQKSGNNVMAAKASEKAALLYLTLNDNTAAGNAQTTAGKAYAALGMHAKAAQNYKEAAISFGVGFKPSATIDAHLAAATSHKISGDFSKAAESYSCAARAQATWSKYHEAGESFHLAAHAHQTAGHKSQAIKAYQASATAYSQAGDSIAAEGSRLAANNLEQNIEMALAR